jgi:hypothetical protein
MGKFAATFANCLDERLHFEQPATALRSSAKMTTAQRHRTC